MIKRHKAAQRVLTLALAVAMAWGGTPAHALAEDHAPADEGPVTEQPEDTQLADVLEEPTDQSSASLDVEEEVPEPSVIVGEEPGSDAVGSTSLSTQSSNGFLGSTVSGSDVRGTVTNTFGVSRPTLVKIMALFSHSDAYNDNVRVFVRGKYTNWSYGNSQQTYEVDRTDWQSLNSTGGALVSIVCCLSPGDYEVEFYRPVNSSDPAVSYTMWSSGEELSSDFSRDFETEINYMFEDDGAGHYLMDHAAPIALNKTYSDAVTACTADRYYVVDIPKDGTYSLMFAGTNLVGQQNPYVNVRFLNYVLLYKDTYSDWYTFGNILDGDSPSYKQTVSLKKGKCFVRVTSDSGNGFQGTFSFAIDAVAQKPANQKKPLKDNTLAVKSTKKTVKYATVRKKKVTVSPLTVTGAVGKVTYTKVSGSKCLRVNPKTGKVTVRRGAKKGTHRAKVKVMASGNATHKKGSKTVKVTIVVRSPTKKNPMTVLTYRRSVSHASAQASNVVVAPLEVKNAKGKVTYKRLANGSSKCLMLNRRTGKVTVKKGTKAGTYKLRAKVTAAGDATHKKKSRTVKVTVEVESSRRQREKEPNDTVAKANKWTYGKVMYGSVHSYSSASSSEADMDCFRIKIPSKGKYRLRIAGSSWVAVDEVNETTKELYVWSEKLGCVSMDLTGDPTELSEVHTYNAGETVHVELYTSGTCSFNYDLTLQRVV